MSRGPLAALAAAIGVACTPFALAQAMTKADYEVERKTVVSDFRTARTGCEPMSAHVRAICFADVRGREAIRLAELEELYQPGPGNRDGVRLAKARAAHALAVEKCGDRDGKAREACLAAAKRLEGES